MVLSEPQNPNPTSGADAALLAEREVPEGTNFVVISASLTISGEIVYHHRLIYRFVVSSCPWEGGKEGRREGSWRREESTNRLAAADLTRYDLVPPSVPCVQHAALVVHFTQGD